MKLATAEDFQGYHDAVVGGGIKGGFLGAGLAGSAYLILNKRSVRYRNLPPAPKAFGAVMFFVPCVYIAAEKAGEAFTRSQYTGVAMRELTREAQEEAKRWESMSFATKMGDWATRHKYQMVGAAWVASLGGAWAITARNPYQSTSQKVVQARMWAQGLTVGLLIASAMLTGFDSSSTEEPRVPHEDHTWRAILESDPHLSESEKQRLHEIKTAVNQRKTAVPEKA